MSEPKPRRWFQIHLSTAVVLMFVAGALIWANVHPRPLAHVVGVTAGELSVVLTVEVDHQQGFPQTWRVVTIPAGFRQVPGASFSAAGRTLGLVTAITEDERRALQGFPATDEERQAWNGVGTVTETAVVWTNLWHNVYVALVILGGVAFVLELFIRRRERQQP